MLMLWFLFPCKSHGFCSHKGRVSFRNFHSPWRFWKKRNFHGEFGDKGQLTWNILRLILFYPTKRWEFGNPKLKETNFPIDLFSVKLLLSNASRPKSSKMSPTAVTLCEEWWFRKRGSSQRWLTWNIVRTFRFDWQSGYHAEIKTSGTQHFPFSFQRAKIHFQHS